MENEGDLKNVFVVAKGNGEALVGSIVTLVAMSFFGSVSLQVVMFQFS